MRIFSLFSPGKNVVSVPCTYKFSYRAKIITIWVISVICLLFLLHFSHLLPVFIWAAVAAYLFNPVITFLSEKTKVARVFYILLLYAIVGLLIFLTAKGVAPLFARELAELGNSHAGQSDSLVSQVSAQNDITLFGNVISIKGSIASVYEWVGAQFNSQALPIMFGALERVVFTLIFFVVTFYFLLQAGTYRDMFESIIPEPYRAEISGLIEKMNFTLGSYIRAQVVLILIMSAASFAVLSVLKIKFAILLSIATGVLEVIPIVGPITATVIVMIVALLQPTVPYGLSHVALAAIVVVSYFVLRQMEDYFIIPNIASKFVKVHPVIGIFSLLVGGSVGGVLGLFLAIPTAALLKVLFGYIYRKLTE